MSLTDEGKTFPVRYGIDAVELLLEVFHFCSAASQGDEDERRYESLSQRALLRNIRFLAEILDITAMSAQHNPTPYFVGMSLDGRSPNPRSDPCFAREDQTLVVMCAAVMPGNEPPVLRSNTLRRNLSGITFDSTFHVNESASWLLYRNVNTDPIDFELMAVITIKDGVNGRGFRILEPRSLKLGTVMMDSSQNCQWMLSVPPKAHLDFMKLIVIGV